MNVFYFWNMVTAALNEFSLINYFYLPKFVQSAARIVSPLVCKKLLDQWRKYMIL